MKPTHQFTNNYGHTYVGVVVSESIHNSCWFLAMCDDGETWMKVPVWAFGVREMTV